MAAASGLRGPATPLSARIVHVADAYDAMTSDRPYRRGMSHEEAVSVLEQYAGTQFDAATVPVFRIWRGLPERSGSRPAPSVRKFGPWRKR